MLGMVKWFDVKKGYGFLLNPDDQDVFVHFTSIVGGGFRALRDGEKVEFEQVEGPKGLYATNVKHVHVRKERPGDTPAQPQHQLARGNRP